MMNLDWGAWAYGLFAALIGGGSAAGASALGAMGLAPGQFGTAGAAGWNSLKLMGISFLISGGISAFAYLSKSPLPSIEKTVSTATTEQQGIPTKVTTTVSETKKD